VILTPDEEVRARLGLIFAKFTALGSARAVRTYRSCTSCLRRAVKHNGEM
jgi:hypothetical protein